MAVLLHDWDACLQDGLAARADVLANAYLLGRGLAECYWALGPEGQSPAAATRLDASSGWAFLLGPPRRKELSRLVGRMGPHINGLTPSAVSGSIEAWGRVAEDAVWRTAPTARAALYEQLRRWYELLVLGRDPTTFVRPYAVLRGWRTTRRAFRALLPQAVLAAVSVAAIAAVVVFLVTDAGRMLLTSLLGLAGVIGLTVAAISAALKSAGQRLFVRLRQDVYSDLVAIAITCVPEHPKAGSGMFFRARTTEGLVRDAVRDRPVTPSTPLLHAPPGPD
jgi:hypothetical protein